MLSKNVIKDIQSLRLKKQRDEKGLFVAEGPKLVSELLPLLPKQIVGVYASKNWMDNNPHIAAEQITDVELERISGLQTPNEVVAVFEQTRATEPFLENEWCIYLDAVQDPGNLGTIIRIADWFGVKHLVCSAGSADLYNPKVIQATMGSIARVTVWYDESNGWLQKQTVPIYAAVLDGNDVWNIERQQKGILVIGNEAKGISDDVLASATHKITIPKRGEAESLNAAVAAGIILSHLIK